jgi:hypothetical protein
MTYINSYKLNVWSKAKGDKKLYSKLLRNKEKEAEKIQLQEKISNLKRMFAKEMISKEEFDSKMEEITKKINEKSAKSFVKKPKKHKPYYTKESKQLYKEYMRKMKED